MGVKKFIKSIQKAFDINIKNEDGKKEKLKELILKLKQKRKEVKLKWEKKQNITAKKLLEEEYEIITLQIKKSRELLKELRKKED